MKKKRSSGMSKKIIENCCSSSLDMIMGSFYIPKEDDLRPEYVGEDSHFICQEKKSFGVADGVGGWIKQGIDSDYALYNSLDRFSESPFSRAAYFAGKKNVGGKIDDITVVVAKII
ncbi:hypothetical protein Dsin_016126 [Dipteronia sinensis]|uniref:Protein phosphatase n=1 Tax=Dipteronia sinensis TaxID=43782 RepID=A0AAE0ADV8_9ROSI|nr:hypothetical protein Dsin_016126 [Dipteronia sinensis]